MSSINSVNSTISGSIISQGVRSRPDPAEKFQQLDANGSGSLDKTELSELAKELSKMANKTLDVEASITTYDTDGDGALSQEETDTMMRETMGPPPGPPPEGSGIGPDKAAFFKELDSDTSGGLSQEELDAMAEDLAAITGQNIDMSEALSKYDADGDGELNAEELEAMMQANMEQPPPPPERIGGTSAQQISDTYLANSGDDELSRLEQLLAQLAENLSANSSNGGTSSTT
jgi:Ca2+-binding EF-hand superfamily protein